ncbi:MAG: hypothetical protein K2X81_08585 [Candidatus Obscuribacterales bacterium]|nr:hypothetical protein [Candidatus Obscuribacterales bacterium]
MKKTPTTKGLPSRQQVAPAHKWRLDHIYSSKTAWQADFNNVQNAIPVLRNFAGKLGKSAEYLQAFLVLADKAEITVQKLLVFATLKHHEDLSVPAYQKMFEKAGNLKAQLDQATSFYMPEILTIKETKLNSMLASNQKLASYKRSIQELTRLKQHVLSDEQEAVLANAQEMACTPRLSYEALVNHDIEFPVLKVGKRNVQLSPGNFVDVFLGNKDQTVRKNGYESRLDAYANHGNTIATLYAGQLASNVFFAKSRGFKSVRQSIFKVENLPESLHDNLITAVSSPKQMQAFDKYLKLRKKVMKHLGLLPDGKMHLYDLHYPIVNGNPRWTWAQAKEILIEASGLAGDKYAQCARDIVNAQRIDLVENQNKCSGAYCLGIYKNASAFIMTNLINAEDIDYGDLLSLMHELSHGVQFVLASLNQPYVNSPISDGIAEVPALIGELLLTQYLISKATHKKQKLFLLHSLIQSVRGSFYRYCTLSKFEHQVQQLAWDGEGITEEVLNETYLQCLKETYGRVLVIDDSAKHEWKSDRYLFSPYSRHQYALAICAALVLVNQFKQIDSNSNQKSNALEGYLKMLEAGSSLGPLEVLKLAGLDFSSAKSIEKALAIFESYVDEFTKLMNEE